MRYHQIVEAKRVGVLFHFTGLHEAWAILEEKELRIGDKEGSFSAVGGGFAMTQPRTHISLTRNPMLPRLGSADRPWGEVRIALDGDKLSQRYKIFPYVDQVHGITRHHGQAEEGIAKDAVKIEGCVLRVDFNFFEWMRKELDFEDWVSPPEPERRDQYTKQARNDAALFVKHMRSLGYKVNVVKAFGRQ